MVRSRDRGIVGEATVDFIRQFKVDIGLIGISGIEADGTPARLRLPRGEGGAGDHRALARGLARRRPQQVQPAGDGRAGAPGPDRPAVHRRAAARAVSRSCWPRPASSASPARSAHDRQDAPAGPRPGHLELAQHRLRPATAASSPWRSASSGRSFRSRAGSSTTRARSGSRSSRPRARRSPRPGSAAGDIAAIGITNQRETTLLWNRRTGEPLAQRHRLAGPAHRAGLRGAERARPRAAVPARRPAWSSTPTSPAPSSRGCSTTSPARAPRPSAASSPSAPSTAG